MIKFFRKIRYNLMEKNKTGKYLKYAIGEIVLVVIGILIALSINNWNESRKEIKLRANYLNVLKTKHTLLVADACFSGGIFKTRKAFNNSGSIEKLYKLPSRKAITSGTLKEVPDQSVFIEYLIKRLNENNNGYLSSEQLFSSMRTAVMNNSPNVPQYGTIQNVGDEGGDFVFILRE